MTIPPCHCEADAVSRSNPGGGGWGLPRTFQVLAMTRTPRRCEGRKPRNNSGVTIFVIERSEIPRLRLGIGSAIPEILRFAQNDKEGERSQ